MYSASPISMTEPPVSWLPSLDRLLELRSVMPKARSLSGSTTTWYWRTMPPIVATSATPGTVCSSYFRNQSCRLRSCARSCCPLRSTSAYWKTQPTPVASGPAPASRLPAAARHLAQVLEHARTRPVQIGAVFENDVDIGVAEERVAAHRERFRHRQHRGRQRIRHLVLDDLRRLAGKRRLDDDLHVGQIRQRVDRRLLARSTSPSAATISAVITTRMRLSIDQRINRGDHSALLSSLMRSSAASIFDSESIRNWPRRRHVRPLSVPTDRDAVAGLDADRTGCDSKRPSPSRRRRDRCATANHGLARHVHDVRRSSRR